MGFSKRKDITYESISKGDLVLFCGFVCIVREVYRVDGGRYLYEVFTKDTNMGFSSNPVTRRDIQKLTTN